MGGVEPVQIMLSNALSNELQQLCDDMRGVLGANRGPAACARLPEKNIHNNNSNNNTNNNNNNSNFRNGSNGGNGGSDKKRCHESNKENGGRNGARLDVGDRGKKK